MKNGEKVAELERVFAEYVNARYAVAMCNGTATLHTALAALGVKQQHFKEPVPYVAVPPLTMASTTIAVLHAGGVPVFVDVDPDTWLAENHPMRKATVGLTVSLYGLHWPENWPVDIDDAAQTLRPHSGAAFTSYSFQASKILHAGEGGMLVTNDEELARAARRFASLGYPLVDSSKIDPATLKRPSYDRHLTLGWNYRMADAVAEVLLGKLEGDVAAWCLGGEFHELKPTLSAWESLIARRRYAGSMYREVVAGCPWITPQHVPEGWAHDYWCYAVALADKALWPAFTDAIVRHGGEMPYGAWRLTYQEPAFRHLAEDGCCPVAEDLQPRLVQFQTNDLASARSNADAVAKAITEIGGTR